MMNLINRRLDTFDRVVKFGVDHPLTPANVKATTLYTSIAGIVSALRDHASDQTSGTGEFRAGASSRQLAAELVLASMRPMNRIARALKREEHPGVREMFFMPSSGGYEGIISHAKAFLDTLGVPHNLKPLFVEHGLPADFDEVLQGRRVELIAVTDRKHGGRTTQVTGTASLLATSREGIQFLRELDSILTARYESNPGLLTAWKSARRVERGPAGSGGTPAPTPAPSSPPPAAPAA